MSGIIAQNVGRHTGLVKACSGGGGSWNLIQTQIASTSSDISFTSGIDSTYDEYIFKFITLHPSAAAHANFNMNFSIDGGSNWNVTKTTTLFRTYHAEDNSAAALLYQTEFDLAQATGDQMLYAYGAGDTADLCWGGYMHLFAPSDKTFVKQFFSEISGTDGNYEHHHFSSGYGNTTSAIDGAIFRMSSGTIDAGQISLFGIS